MKHLLFFQMFGFIFSNCQSPKFQINPQFEAVQAFYQGIAAAKQDNRWGFIDGTGAWVLAPQFTAAERPENRAYRVLDSADQCFEIVKAPDGGAWSAFPCAATDVAIQTSVGLRFIFYADQRCGLRDAKGQVLTPPVYQSIRYLGENLFAASLGSKGECLLSAQGKTLGDYHQEIAEQVQYGRIRFRDNDHFGLLVPDGSILLKPTQWLLEIVGRNIACTEGGNYLLCNDRLEKLSDFKFDKVLHLDDKHWMAKSTDTGMAMIFDVEGQVVKAGLHLSNGTMLFNRLPVEDIQQKKWGYVNSLGETVIPAVFEYTESFWPNGKAVFFDRDAQGNSKQGLIDTSGKIIQAAIFDAILWHPDGVYTVVQAEHFQLLDENLKPLTPRIKKPVEYAGGGVYVQYALKSLLEFKSANWYTGEKGGFHRRREASVAAVYALGGALLLNGREWSDDDALPRVAEGLAPGKKNGKWGFVQVK